MNLLRKLFLLIKEIGVADLVSYTRYQFELRSGWLKKQTPPGGSHPKREWLLEAGVITNTWRENWHNSRFSSGADLPREEARLLMSGSYRPFFGTEKQLDLKLPALPLQHWTAYSNEFDNMDIKLTWEPARFTWSLALARAYLITPDDTFPEMFWRKLEEFNTSNPVNLGPNWSSAQEVALRAVNWILCLAAFENSPSSTGTRLDRLSRSITHHIERVLPTLNYARAQHNNHLLSEALGLIIGGTFLGNADHRAAGWVDQGIREFEQAIIEQIDNEGNYAQHSTNYHRMMLHLALLYETCLRKSGRKIPQPVMDKLSLATRWLVCQLEPTNGHLPNLGHNDGTLLLPFGCVDYRDCRPVAQAAAIAFLGKPCLPPGDWNELAAWLGLEYDAQNAINPASIVSPAVHKVGNTRCRGSLRGVRFHNRPAHADQLHVEIWWHGINLARDAGTFLYNSPPPWQNGLDRTRVHNTVTIDIRDQMARVSRFLWLDQAQATWAKTGEPETISAALNNYNRTGISHQRSLTAGINNFRVVDVLTPEENDTAPHNYCLHWLLPDWQWQVNEGTLTLSHENLRVNLHVSVHNTRTNEKDRNVDMSIIRAGVALTGQRQDEVLGWESETYGEKHPVLSFSVTNTCVGPLRITSEWELIDESN